MSTGRLNYLLDTYYNKEDWHESRLAKWQAEEHFKRQLHNNNIAFMRGVNDEIVGYLEIYWLTNHQADKIVHGKPFDVLAENLNNGDIVFVASAYLEPEWRGKGYIHDLNRLMKEQHYDRDYEYIMYEDGHNKGKFSFYKKGEI